MPPNTLFTKTGIFPSPPVRATHYQNTNQDRSESSIVVNPTTSFNLVGASKLFTEPKKYKFTVATIYSTNGGATWNDSEPLNLLAGWEGLSDPALAVAPSGTVYLITEPLNFNYKSDPDYDPTIAADIVTTRMVCYRSDDGGATWNDPVVIDENQDSEWRFDKPWAAVSPVDGTVYAAWGYPGVQFARSQDGGATWSGVGNQPIDTVIGGEEGPEIDVDAQGNVHIFSHNQQNHHISYLRLKSGAQSFDPEQYICQGMIDLDSGIPGGGFRHFPNATFRVVTLTSACCSPTRIAVAWADYREDVSRIYYNTSPDGGDTWSSVSGMPLLPPVSSTKKFHDFHPQIVATGSGIIGCAFYRYYEVESRIDVMFTASFDEGATFWLPVKLSTQPWDPAVNAPWSHQNPDTTFIGEYFGLDADADDFYALWTNTQDGVQELYFNYIATSKTDVPDILGGIVAQVFGGVAADGGGFVIVNGHFVPVPPWNPLKDVLHGIVALDALGRMKTRESAAMQRNLLETMASTLKNAAREIGAADTSAGRAALTTKVEKSR